MKKVTKNVVTVCFAGALSAPGLILCLMLANWAPAWAAVVGFLLAATQLAALYLLFCLVGADKPRDGER